MGTGKETETQEMSGASVYIKFLQLTTENQKTVIKRIEELLKSQSAN